MDDPIVEISDVILHLTCTPPSVQQATVQKYFTPDAQFVHPFCRTVPLYNSRFQVERIYRWYKILSPKISIRVHSISWDRANDILYVGITQVFAIWAFPTHKAEVSLVTVLRLEQGFDQEVPLLDARGVSKESNVAFKRSGKWYIKSQNDLYQTDQFVKFALPHFAWIFPLWQYFATFVCVICSYLFAPVTWWEETHQKQFSHPQLPPAWNDAT